MEKKLITELEPKPKSPGIFPKTFIRIYVVEDYGKRHVEVTKWVSGSSYEVWPNQVSFMSLDLKTEEFFSDFNQALQWAWEELKKEKS